VRREVCWGGLNLAGWNAVREVRRMGVVFEWVESVGGTQS
jgi:hypothetical protein